MDNGGTQPAHGRCHGCTIAKNRRSRDKDIGSRLLRLGYLSPRRVKSAARIDGANFGLWFCISSALSCLRGDDHLWRSRRSPRTPRRPERPGVKDYSPSGSDLGCLLRAELTIQAEHLLLERATVVNGQNVQRLVKAKSRHAVPLSLR